VHKKLCFFPIVCHTNYVKNNLYNRIITKQLSPINIFLAREMLEILIVDEGIFLICLFLTNNISWNIWFDVKLKVEECKILCFLCDLFYCTPGLSLSAFNMWTYLKENELQCFFQITNTLKFFFWRSFWHILSREQILIMFLY
jgi:hypothetical protein